MASVDPQSPSKTRLWAIPLVALTVSFAALWTHAQGTPVFHPADVPLGDLGAVLLVLLFFSVLTERAVELLMHALHGAERISVIAPLSEELSHNAAISEMMRRDMEMLSNPSERVALFTEELAGEAAMTRSATAAVVAQVSRALSRLRQKKLRHAAFLSFVIGIAISAAGFRVFGGVLSGMSDATAIPVAQSAYISVLDMLLTATAIAGCSEIIHRMVTGVLKMREPTIAELVHDCCQIKA